MSKTKAAAQTGKKGQFQYIDQEKKRRIIKTIFFFIPSIVLFIAGMIIFDSRKNVLTIGAILSCLPACKQVVGVVMIFLYRSMPAELYKRIVEKAGSLTMVYELILTNYEKNTPVDAIAICGNQVVGLTSYPKADLKYVEKNTRNILKHNGYDVKVKIFKDERKFLEQMDALNKNADTLRENIPFTPDERYPDLSREELIRHTILAISL